MKERRRELGQYFWGAAALVLLLAAFAGVIFLIVLAVQAGATVLAAILAAFATVAAAMAARFFERRREVEAARREHLGDLYADLGAVLAGQSLPKAKLEKLVPRFQKMGLIYASGAVLKAYREWRLPLFDLPDNTAEWPLHVEYDNAVRYESFVRAMRKDLGVSNWALQEGDLARAVLIDWDKRYSKDLVQASREVALQAVSAENQGPS